MDHKLQQIERWLFILAVILLPISVMPKPITLSFLGGFGSAYSIYPIIIGILFYIYHYRLQWLKENKFAKLTIGYTALYVVYFTFSLILGVYNYEFKDSVNIYELKKIEMLGKYLAAYGIDLQSIFNVAFIVFLKSFKDLQAVFLLLLLLFYG